MDPLCRSCERRTQDHGGCRCQAFLLTGRAEAVDPACSLSPDHALVTEQLPEAQELVQVGGASGGETEAWKYRVNPS
jgi:pyrroloquinoline quinone biosynthesis protein E